MQRSFRLAGLLVLIAFVLPLAGADDVQKADPKPKAEDKKKDDEKKADPKGKSDEKKDDEKKEEKKPEPKATTDPKEKWILAPPVNGKLVKVSAQKITCAVSVPYPNGNKIDYRDENMEFETAETVTVRVPQPPAAFDDKGRPKRYTAKELAEFKGPDKKMPGYAADMESLKPGQYVTVILGKKKSAPKNDPAVVTAIFIVKEAAAP